MSKRIQRVTKMACYIADNYGTVNQFIRRLNKWAKMDIYRVNGSSVLRYYANGKYKPVTRQAVKKWDIVCDYVESVSGERPTFDWLNLINTTPTPQQQTAEVLEIPFANDIKPEAAPSPEFEEIGRAFVTLTTYFANLFNNKN